MTTTFKYQARDASGKTVKGSMQAASQSDVVADLRRRRLTPVEISKSGGGLLAGGGSKGPKRRRVKKATVRKGELEIFTRQLSTMLSAGIPMLEALEILAEQAESPGFGYGLNKIVEDIRGGADLSNAFR